MESIITQSELASLGEKLQSYVKDSSLTSHPLITQGEDWVRVNNLLVTQNSEERYDVKLQGRVFANFSRRAWAVGFAVAWSSLKIEDCLEIQNLASKIEQNEQDILVFNHNKKLATLKNNHSKANILEDRISQSTAKCNYYEYQLSQILKRQVIS